MDTTSALVLNDTEEKKLNYVGGISFDLTNPLHKLKMVGASCFFGEPSYYLDHDPRKNNMVNARLSPTDLEHLVNVLKGVIPLRDTIGKSNADVLEEIIDEALDFNIEGTLQIAVDLRNNDYIRTTPQIIMVRAANHPKSKGNGLISKYALDIIKRMDEPSVQMSYQIKKFGRKSIPNSLKKAWKKMLETSNDYTLAKYRMESRQVKTIDVVRLSHARNESIDKLVKDELKSDNKTWESLISTEGSTKETWEKVIDDLWIEVE